MLRPMYVDSFSKKTFVSSSESGLIPRPGRFEHVKFAGTNAESVPSGKYSLYFITETHTVLLVGGTKARRDQALRVWSEQQDREAHPKGEHAAGRGGRAKKWGCGRAGPRARCARCSAARSACRRKPPGQQRRPRRRSKAQARSSRPASRATPSMASTTSRRARVGVHVCVCVCVCVCE
jgi:hypothetical protein